jgi:undecaprenyl-diphosphatase
MRAPRQRADWNIVIRRFALAAGALWSAALALTFVIAGHPGTPAVDLAAADSLHTFALNTLWLATLARILALLGSGFVLVPLTLTLVVLLYRSGRVWWAAWLGAAGVGGLLISQTVKRLVDRQRPTWENPLHELTTPSFPSGHAMAGIYAYVAFGIVALVVLRQRWPGLALITVGVLMGPSRVAFGVHWPSDVLAGWLFASAWLCTVTAVLLWRLGPPVPAIPTMSAARA